MFKHFRRLSVENSLTSGGTADLPIIVSAPADQSRASACERVFHAQPSKMLKHAPTPGVWAWWSERVAIAKISRESHSSDSLVEPSSQPPARSESTTGDLGSKARETACPQRAVRRLESVSMIVPSLAAANCPFYQCRGLRRDLPDRTLNVRQTGRKLTSGFAQSTRRETTDFSCVGGHSAIC